eukprot:CAMPEP_0169114548 /NCGR_PEP_ID=MMETSP1015-20121227/28816_1 /TAXON_ID=342587 /ORGANISM="Karlodinium micrum, Strain CCMP2283" /LENGTH=145 /DNA_ID=CAMNT_0009176837 /DNA_START=28 /DNA_END=465 /DNA_ORIENTATION=+
MPPQLLDCCGLGVKRHRHVSLSRVVPLGDFTQQLFLLLSLSHLRHLIAGHAWHHILPFLCSLKCTLFLLLGGKILVTTQSLTLACSRPTRFCLWLRPLRATAIGSSLLSLQLLCKLAVACLLILSRICCICFTAPTAHRHVHVQF